MPASRPVRVDILVIEDSPTQAERLRFLLERDGYGVRTAANGREALAVLQSWRPTLIVTDVVMPEMDGYALCRAVKADPALQDIPVIIVTSLAGIEDIAHSLECGADNFIRKPYDPKMLLGRIGNILRTRQQRPGRSERSGMDVYVDGKKKRVTAGREQIVDLLVSTYEEAVQLNEELQAQQAEIARSNEVLAGLYSMADELNRVTDENAVCEHALQALLDMRRFASGWIFLAQGDGGCRLAASRNLPAGIDVAAPAGDCNCWRAFQSGDQAPGTFIVECEPLRGLPGPGRHACIPLKAEGRSLGVINLLASGERFEPEDLRMLDAIGNQVAVALERARLYGHLEAQVAQRTAALRQEVAERDRAERHLARLNRIHQVLSGINSTILRVHERQTLFQDACRIAVEQGGFGLAWIGIRDDQGTLRPMAWETGAAWSEVGAPVPRLDGALDRPLGSTLGRVLSTGRPAICRNLEESDDVPLALEAVRRGFRSVAGLPLTAAGSPVGLLALYASEPDLFDEQEMRLLEDVVADISFALDYLAQEARISYLAYYDALTGLPNRQLLVDRLWQAIGFAQRHQRAVAVICLDLDRFQLVNDALGHHAGDHVLRVVGDRLTACLREGDTAGRVSGDEFAVIFCDLPPEEDTEALARRLRTAISAPIHVEGEALHLSASVGMSMHPRDGEDAAMLLKYAALAVYEAKEQGRDTAQQFTPELRERAAGRLQVRNRLAEAPDRNEFALHYQPQFDASTGAIVGAEALIRWRHPELGLVSPGQFIPVAEESGLIVRIGEWVLREACRQNKAWHDAGLSTFPISVNLSLAQFRGPALLDSIRQALAETGLDPRHLELEVTESVVMSNTDMFVSFLHELKAQGIGLAIDDFGTGYSSLTYLHKLPVDRLKVDHSFVRDITVDPGSASICRAVVAVAHSLRLGVVAEGVETAAQAEYLARHDYDSLQGYLLCAPRPADEITELLGTYVAAPRPAWHAPHGRH